MPPPKTIIIKIILIIAIILTAIAQVLPWGELNAEGLWTVHYFHWGGEYATYAGEEPNLEIILPWTDFSSENATIVTYLYAASTLLLYLILPLSIGSFILGLLAYFRPTKKQQKHTFQAAIAASLAILFFILFIHFGILPRLEEGLSGISDAFQWTTGFYIMIAAAILYFLAFTIVKKYPTTFSKSKTKSNKDMKPSR